MEKSAKEFDEKVLKSSVVIVDVEGTTTSISFVKDVLFPYATEKVGDFLAAKWDVEGVQEAVEGMRQQAVKDIAEGVEGAVAVPDKDSAKEEQIAGVAGNLKWLISIDNKGSFMKKLSGLIWEEGYSKGDIKGHVYKDVQPALESWRALNKRVYIYSSGSVLAQKLLMRHSEVGDISGLFDGHFDTAVGAKQEASSYSNIVKEIGCQAEETLFLTDIVKEAVAAREAGLNTVLLKREGNAPLSTEDLEIFPSVESFQELLLQASSTKRKQESAQEEELPPTKIAKTVPDSGEVVTEENNKTETTVSEAMEVDVVQNESELPSNGLAAVETPIASNVEETSAANEKAEEIKNGDTLEETIDDKPVLESKKDEVTVETKIEPSPIAESESTDKPAEEALDVVADVSPAVDATPAESKNGDQPTQVETEAPKADDCNKKTDIDNNCSDKDQVPETMETDAEASTETSDSTEKEDISPIKTDEVVDTPPSTDVAGVDQSTDKTESGNGTAELVPESAEEVIPTEKPVEQIVEKTEEVVENQDPVEKVVSPSTDIKMDAEEAEAAPAVGDIDVCSVENTEDTESKNTVEKDTELNDILGEVGAALDKACDVLLSKVDEMTNKNITSVKPFLAKAIAENEANPNEANMEGDQEKPTVESDSLATSDDNSVEKISPLKNGTQKETIEPVDTEKIEVDNKIENVETELKTPDEDTKDPVPEEKTTPEAPAESKEVAINNGDANKANGKQGINGKSLETEVNGQSCEDKPSEEQKAQNGKSQVEDKSEEISSEDRLKGSNGKATEENKPTEPTAEQLKLKKVTAEETGVEQAAQQVAET